jgi:diguanylate cyclase (GGDEF)-like protein/PAS domain S-box-containing protein
LGLDPAQLVGQPASVLFDEITPGTDPMILNLHQKDGTHVSMEGTILPIAGTPLTLLAARAVKREQDPNSLLNSIQDAILTYDTEHRVTWMNQAAESLYGFTAAFAKGKTLSEIQPDWLQVPARDQIRQALDRDGAWKGEISNFTPSGREIVQEVSIAVTFNEKKEVTGSVAVHRDITAKKSAVDALAAEDKTKTLNALGSTEGLWDWNLRTDEVYFSPRWKEMLGYSDEEITGDLGEWYMLVHPDDLPLLRNRIATYLKGQPEHLEAEYRARTRGGQFRWMMTRAIAMRNESGEPTRLVGLQTDIHDQKQLDEQLLFEAFHDSVTGLANRALFLDRLSGLLAHPNQPFAVAFLDLVKFAQVNEVIGTRGGDKALAEAGRRIAESLPPNSFVARHGSDEFVALIPTAEPTKLEALTALLRSRMAKPFDFGGKQVSFDINIGYATTLARGYKDAEVMLQEASRAMAAHQPVSSPVDSGFDEFQPEQFRVFYHPIVDLETGEIGGIEALIRWQHPERGLLTPDQFLPAAEASGLILELDRWMLREACAKANELNTRTHRIHPLILTVNLSSSHFLDCAHTIALEEVIRESGIDANWLRIELNEQSTHSTTAILHQLSQLHVRLNIHLDTEVDLSRFAADRIKIPANLVRGLASGRNIEKVRSIIHTAQRQNMQVVAEGVESLEQLAVLRELKCHLAQGFYFTKPASANDTERLLARSPRW